VSAAAGRPRTRLAALALVVATVVLYLPSVGGAPVFDDDVFVFENPLIHAPDGLARFWLSTEPPDYFPVTSSMLWLEWRLWGDDTTGYHVVNVLLHALSCVLLWRVLLRLGVPGAWLAGLLFAVHPVNVESVAWITQRKNTLPMVFYLASVLLYLRFDERASAGERRGGLYGAALAAHAVALLAKTSVVSLPFVLLLCAWWRRGRVTRRDLARTAPFFALSLVLGLVTVWYQLEVNIGDEVVRDDGALSRLAIAGKAVGFYLSKALVPLELSTIYPRWAVDPGDPRAYVPLALLVGCFALLWARRDAWGRPLLLALAYYVLGLLPILGFVDNYFMKYSLVADHWQYTSLVGVVAAVAAGLAWLGARLPGRLGPWVTGAAVALPLAALTWRQQDAYRDSEALWADTLRKNPSAWIAHHGLGQALEERGAREEAIAAYRTALGLRPDFGPGHYALAQALDLEGHAEEALAAYREARRLLPDVAHLESNLGGVLYRLERHEEALVHYARAAELDPGTARYAHNAGQALQTLGRFEEAFEQLALALQRAPDDVQLLIDFAWLSATCEDAGARDGLRAVELAQRAAELVGEDDPVVQSTLAAAHAALDDFERAVQLQEAAIGASPPERREALHRRLDAYRGRRNPPE